MTLSEHVVHDYASTSFSLKAHPVSFVREQLDRLHIISASALETAKDGDHVKVAGLVLVRQRPGTASGICFITIEDETGTANLVVFKKLFDQYRKEIIQSRLLMVEGKLQREGEVIHVIVQRCYNFGRLLQQLTASQKQDISLKPMSRSDETIVTVFEISKRRKVKLFRGTFFRKGGILGSSISHQRAQSFWGELFCVRHRSFSSIPLELKHSFVGIFDSWVIKHQIPLRSGL